MRRLSVNVVSSREAGGEVLRESGGKAGLPLVFYSPSSQSSLTRLATAERVTLTE